MKYINRVLPFILAAIVFISSCVEENFPAEYLGEMKYEVYSSNINRNCISLFFLNEEIGYATTQEGEVFKTSNGGIKWKKLEILSPVPLRTSCFLNKDVGYVFGGKSGCSPSPCEPFGSIAYKTSDGGESWQKQNIPYKWSRLNSAYFFNENNGVAVGLGLCIKTSNGGITWQSITVGKNNLSKILFLNQNVGYALDLMGGFYKTEDRGESWKDVIIGDNKNTSQFFFINEESGFASGSNKLLKTTDGGNSWNVIDSLKNSINFIHFVNENSGVTISKRYASDGGGFAPTPFKHVIKQTNDGGQTWTLTEYDENEFNERCLYAKENIIYSLGYDKVFKLKIE